MLKVFISKYKAGDKNDPRISSPTANTTPGPSSIPSRIMKSIEALAIGIEETVVGTDPAINLTDTPAGIIKLIDSLARSGLPNSPLPYISI
ncbi:hypothetical protein DID88_001966 [Monilinia fructigena]|uniref:Uncharacterized protein n=1 Tax=Monilinia fructigena TaxID=38457 RepID=A0A395IWH3_9HELO|nr:hypothetical protein DID88_001966 [Monilinia fructigena]